MATLREISKNNFSPRIGNLEELNAGSLQRIADAAELTAKNYIELQQQVKRLEEHIKLLRIRLVAAEKRCSSFKGVITKLKKKISHVST